MQQNDTVAFIQNIYYCSQMLSFFALTLQLKLKVNRIFRFKTLEKRVFYLSSSFSLLLDFLVSILLFAMTPNGEKNIDSTESHCHTRSNALHTNLNKIKE